MSSGRSEYDVVVVGGGDNALVAATYLARAGLSVLVLERLAHVGGAAALKASSSLVAPMPGCWRRVREGVGAPSMPPR